MTSPSSSPHVLPTLPHEIIYQIIDSIIPSGQIDAIALPPSYQATKTLLALMQTSRVTYEPALKLLYSCCLHINSIEKLSLLTATLKAPPPPIQNLNPSTTSHSTRTTPPLLIKHIKSLYLAPFPDGTSAVKDVNQLIPLLELLAPRLERLILSLPGPGPNFEISLPTLRKLTSLEVFCSTDDHTWLVNDSQENEFVWTTWPNLRVIALGFARPCKNAWKLWGRMENLERVILGSEGWDYRIWAREYQEGQREMEGQKRLEVEVVKGCVVRQWRKKQSDGELLRVRTVYPPRRTLKPHWDRGEIMEWITGRVLFGNESLGL